MNRENIFGNQKKRSIFASLLTKAMVFKAVLSREGRLAQLVQSIWFTPRGSGVRIPQRPQLLQKIPLERRDFFCVPCLGDIKARSVDRSVYSGQLIIAM